MTAEKRQQCCKTCLFSRWWLTETGRIKKRSAGHCTVEIVPTILPACCRKHVYEKTAIWPEFGDECPLYQENPGKPISETMP